MINAPRVNTNFPADAWLHIADITSGDHDLRTVSGGGKFAAQRVRLHNGTAGPLTAVLIPEQRGDGTTSQPILVPANQDYDVLIPIKTIVAVGSGALSADVYWWFANSIEINR